jgi:hypothetical protein
MIKDRPLMGRTKKGQELKRRKQDLVVRVL